MKTKVLKTSNGNYVALINGNETFIYKDGASGPTFMPMWKWLKDTSPVLEVDASEPSQIIAEYEKTITA